MDGGTLKMSYDHAVQALRREKELLEKIFCLSEYQLRLIQGHDVEGFEAFLPLLGEPMAELADAEYDVEATLTDLENNGLTLQEQTEIERWSDAIAELANRIADIDERTAAAVDAESFDIVH
jgi:hypothetical protein